MNNTTNDRKEVYVVKGRNVNSKHCWIVLSYFSRVKAEAAAERLNRSSDFDQEYTVEEVGLDTTP